MKVFGFTSELGVSIGERFFLNNEFADEITNRTTLGFVDVKFKSTGDPCEHGLEQTRGQRADWFLGTMARPTDWAAMDRPDERVVRFVHG